MLISTKYFEGVNMAIISVNVQDNLKNKFVKIVKIPVQSCRCANIEESRESAGNPKPIKVLFKPSVPIVPSA